MNIQTKTKNAKSQVKSQDNLCLGAQGHLADSKLIQNLSCSSLMDEESKSISYFNNKPINSFELTEKDFYPPEDTRIYCSGVEDIEGGDTFADYANWFYGNYTEDLFDE